MRALTLRQLRAVLAVDRLGKVNAAARALGLTAPAVTLQIQQAEIAAGALLFERASDGFHATDAGRATIAAAQDIEQRLLLLGEEVTAIGGGEKGFLRLGAVSTAKYFVPTIIAGFAAEHPGVEVRLTVANRAGIIAALDAREIDIALMGRPPRAAEVATHLIGDHPLVIIAAPGHALVGAQRISKRRIAEETFLVREPGSGTRTSLELFLGEVPGRLDRLGPEFNSNETIKQGVMAQMGVAMISAHTIALELEVGRLAVLDVVGTPLMRQWFVVSHAKRLASPAMAAFKGFVVERGRGFLPG